jgi:hypothetical protein
MEIFIEMLIKIKNSFEKCWQILTRKFRSFLGIYELFELKIIIIKNFIF